MIIKNFDEKQVISTHSVIVIGAGLGGLGAACQLGLAGENVLVLEKNNVPGGFATSFIRGRFEFEGALHELDSFGSESNQGPLYRFFTRIGLIPGKVKFKQVPELYRSVFFDGYDVTMPFGVDAYFDKLIELFPAEQKGIEDFKEICMEVQKGMEFIAIKRGKASPQEILKEHPWLARVSGLTVLEIFKRYFKNKRLMSVLAQLWGYGGLPPSKLNAILFIAMYMSYLTRGGAFPVGRSHALTSGMVKCIEEFGGTVKFNALVNRILVENNHACGVELLNGDIYLSKAIISNANPICTTMKMLPLEIVPESYIKRIYAPEIGPSAFSVYIGLNATFKELGLTAHENFINKDDDMDAAYESTKRMEGPESMVAACYNHVDANISPPGTTQLVLTTGMSGKIWYNVPPDQYHNIKDEIADHMISIVEKTISPNIRDYIEVVEAATPLTYYRYSKNLDGAIYGYTQGVLDSPMLRLKSRGAIPGLYLAGAWTNIGGGFSSTINSGRIAAGMCLKELKKEVS